MYDEARPPPPKVLLIVQKHVPCKSLLSHTLPVLSPHIMHLTPTPSIVLPLSRFLIIVLLLAQFRVNIVYCPTRSFAPCNTARSTLRHTRRCNMTSMGALDIRSLCRAV